MRLGYADPPYPGRSRYYRGHPDYGGEVDQRELLERLAADFDGWLLHTSSTALRELLPIAPPGTRVVAWVKPWTAYKKGQGVAYAWEPVLVWPARSRPGPEQAELVVLRDWLAHMPTQGRGLVGAKPEAVCRWLFDLLGAEPSDELVDLFPGTGAVSEAWRRWTSELRMAL